MILLNKIIKKNLKITFQVVEDSYGYPCILYKYKVLAVKHITFSV